jgi:hypothetical protein
MTPRDIVSSYCHIIAEGASTPQFGQLSYLSLRLERDRKLHTYLSWVRGYVVLCSLMRGSERAPHLLSVMLWLTRSASKLVVTARVANYLIVSLCIAKSWIDETLSPKKRDRADLWASLCSQQQGAMHGQYCLRNRVTEMASLIALHARPVTQGPAIRERKAEDDIVGKRLPVMRCRGGWKAPCRRA